LDKYVDVAIRTRTPDILDVDNVSITGSLPAPFAGCWSNPDRQVWDLLVFSKGGWESFDQQNSGLT
jgi:hypothetical protein